MATKKDKRLAMEQKRIREAEETRRSGLKAQERDRQQRAARAKAAAEKKALEEKKRQNLDALKAVAEANEVPMDTSELSDAACV